MLNTLVYTLPDAQSVLLAFLTDISQALINCVLLFCVQASFAKVLPGVGVLLLFVSPVGKNSIFHIPSCDAVTVRV
ncbi:hypothetical protein D3C87_1004260 [compost metagenome]